ncbi:MAG: hypothetical protein GKR89_00045 [Candidatus Latescibacteria bacterium]|nr:hypothetical protein [Candidatus Latescibacterota bacterium]
MAKPRILFDHDARHPLIYMYEPPIQRAELEAGVDELAGTPVEALMLMLGDVRSLLYASKAGESWGQHVERWPHIIWRRAQQNFAQLIEAGHDPLQVLCDRAHAKGMKLYAQLLVQQGPRERMLKSWEQEGADAEAWRLDLQPWEIGAKGGVEADWPGYRCPDFMRDEVRAGTLAVVEEVLRDYPVDGFELQMAYTPYLFHPDEVEEGRAVMNEWIGQVHRAVRQRPDRELVVTVPAALGGCRAVGLDPLGWIEGGLVDALVAEPAAPLDPETDFGPLIEAARGRDCRILAALHSRVDSDRIGEATTAMMRAAACNYWRQGIDGMYLAHWFGCWPYGAEFYEKLREVPDADIMAPKDKIYRVPSAKNAPAGPLWPPQKAPPLPLELPLGQAVTVPLTISDDLAYWGQRGRVHEVLLRLRLQGATEQDLYAVHLNGQPLPDGNLRRINRLYTMAGPRYRADGYWFIYRLEGDHWPVSGRNTLQMLLQQRDGEAVPGVLLGDVELEIRYLLGRHFHRGFVDADLGPWEGERERL